MGFGEELPYTEQVLQSLESFTTPNGFRVEALRDASDKPQVWVVFLVKTPQVRGWLAQAYGGYAWAPKSAQQAREARITRWYRTAEPALAALQEWLLARDTELTLKKTHDVQR